MIDIGDTASHPGVPAETDAYFLRQAIQLAVDSLESGDPPYGSLLVNSEGMVLTRARNTTVRDRDLTAHPELTIAQWAHRHLEPPELRAATLYTSCEPCPMCRNAIQRSGIARVCYALGYDQLDRLKPTGYVSPDAHEPDYEGPYLFDEARAPLDRFFARNSGDR